MKTPGCHQLRDLQTKQLEEILKSQIKIYLIIIDLNPQPPIVVLMSHKARCDFSLLLGLQCKQPLSDGLIDILENYLMRLFLH